MVYPCVEDLVYNYLEAKFFLNLSPDAILGCFAEF